MERPTKTAMSDLKIIVTGAGGLIGSHAVKVLCEKEYRVIALHRRLDQPRISHDVVQGDLLSDSVLHTLSPITFDLIVHCAAVLPSRSCGDADQAAKSNLAMDERILRVCMDRGCHLVYLSGTSVYGGRIERALDEESEVSPVGPYLKAKVQSEKRILDEIPEASTILRVSAPYGPGQRSRTVLRVFIERALAGLDLIYHGTGKRQQDFIAACDVGNAVLCAVRNTQAHGIFNIAGGKPISMHDLADVVLRTISGARGRAVPSGLPDPQENEAATFDISKARRKLGWSPTVTLEEGIRLWAEYLRKNNRHRGNGSCRGKSF